MSAAVSTSLLAAATMGAQQIHSVADQPAATDSLIIPRPEWPTLSPKVREQLAAVERAVTTTTTDAAAAAGFQSELGVLPTMGEHWINVRSMRRSRRTGRVDSLHPAQLMFSPVGGKMRLVGAAYAFIGQLADAPDLFDGDQDVWHEHPEFAPPGLSLVMLHVWFVPSPDGPFAGHNPWLPYWAAGLEPPPDSALRQPIAGPRARRLGLALAEALEPMPLFWTMYDSAFVPPPSVAPMRDSLRAAIPRLKAARQAGDQAAWDREADVTIAVWERIRDAYLNAVIPEARGPMQAFYRQMERGGHDHGHMPAHMHDDSPAHPSAEGGRHAQQVAP